jgi:HAD superfamily hydrolase (TIGR01509 family)
VSEKKDDPPKSGVFFDWDGCLADTLAIWMKLYKSSLAKRGVDAEEAAIVRELFNDWSGPARFGVEDTEAFAGEIIRGLEERIHEVRLNPNARIALAALKRRGNRTAILTGSKRSFVEPILAREGIESLVDLLVCLDDVERHKPHPEAVENALQSLDLSKDRAVMVGDSSKDIEMGRNGGIATVLYFPEKNQRYYELERLESYRPDYTIRDFRELLDIVG